MATIETYNMAEINFSMTIGNQTIDVVKDGGIDAEGSIEVTFPTDQFEVKEDVTGEYAQFNYKNSKKTGIKLSAMHGSKIHKLVAHAKAFEEAAKIGKKYLKPIVFCSWKDPLLEMTYTFKGGIKTTPMSKFQGTLEAVDIELDGIATLALEAAVDVVENVQGLYGNIQNLNNSI